MIRRMCDQFALLKRFHARQTGWQTDMELIDSESGKAEKQEDKQDCNRKDAPF